MSDPKLAMEVPPQVRDFAVKSVDQAERAISSFLESASKSVAMVPSPMNDVGQQALAITEKNLKASFEHARTARLGLRTGAERISRSPDPYQVASRPRCAST
jgi:hypothetical protein